LSAAEAKASHRKSQAEIEGKLSTGQLLGMPSNPNVKTILQWAGDLMTSETAPAVIGAFKIVRNISYQRQS